MTAQRIPLFIVQQRRLVMPGADGSWSWLTADLGASLRRIDATVAEEAVFYVYDADGVAAGAPDHEFLQRLERRQLFPWAHPGCRSAEDAMDAFFAGAQELTVEARHMDDEKLGDLMESAEADIHVAYPFHGKALDPPLRASEVQRRAADFGMAGVVLVPSPEADARVVYMFADELRRYGSRTSLLGITGRWAQPGADADPHFDRIIHAAAGRSSA